MKLLFAALAFLLMGFFLMLGFMGLDNYDFKMVCDFIEAKASDLAFLLGDEKEELLALMYEALKEADLNGFNWQEYHPMEPVGQYYVLKALLTVRLKVFLIHYWPLLLALFSLFYGIFYAIKHTQVVGTLNLQQTKILLYALFFVQWIVLSYVLLIPSANVMVAMLLMTLTITAAGIVHYAFLGFH